MEELELLKEQAVTRRLILDNLERLSERQDRIESTMADCKLEMERQHSDLKVEIAVIKTKATMTAAAIGLVAGVISFLASIGMAFIK